MRRHMNDYVTACNSLKGLISDMQVTADFETRPHKAVTFVAKKSQGRNGTSKNCRRRYLDTAEEDYQEKARKRKVGEKEKKAKNANKGRTKMRKSTKELEALRGWPSRDKITYKGGIARRLRVKKKKVGKKTTKWQDNGKRSNIWMT